MLLYQFVSLVALRHHVVGIVELVKIVHLFGNTIIANTIFINLVALFKILVAHDIVVTSQ